MSLLFSQNRFEALLLREGLSVTWTGGGSLEFLRTWGSWFDTREFIEAKGPRYLALCALAVRLPESVLGEAMNVVRSFRDDGQRFEALAALAARLPGPLLGEAMNLVESFHDDGQRSEALVTRLAPRLPELLLVEAMRVVRSFRDDRQRSKVLAALAPLACPRRCWVRRLP